MKNIYDESESADSIPACFGEIEKALCLLKSNIKRLQDFVPYEKRLRTYRSLGKSIDKLEMEVQKAGEVIYTLKKPVKIPAKGGYKNADGVTLAKEQVEVKTTHHPEQLLEEALWRIKLKPANAGGRGWQVGGAYWRVATVLREYLEPLLDANEKDHANFIREVHAPSDLKPSERIEEIAKRVSESKEGVERPPMPIKRKLKEVPKLTMLQRIARYFGYELKSV